MLDQFSTQLITLHTSALWLLIQHHPCQAGLKSWSWTCRRHIIHSPYAPIHITIYHNIIDLKYMSSPLIYNLFTLRHLSEWNTHYWWSYTHRTFHPQCILQNLHGWSAQNLLWLEAAWEVAVPVVSGSHDGGYQILEGWRGHHHS